MRFQRIGSAIARWSVLSLSLILFLSVARSAAGAGPKGVVPVGADGKPLNLSFEDGTLKDWTSEGNAFDGQPVKGDTVFPRRSDTKSQHAGEFWIGGFELNGDDPVGTLTSAPFKVTHRWASFRVA